MSEESPEKRCNELEVGDTVWIRNYRNSPRWIPGFVTMKYGPRNYHVNVNEKHHKRHVDQLRPRYVEIVKDQADKCLDFPNQHSDQEQENQPIPPALPRRYPIRENQRPPDKLRY